MRSSRGETILIHAAAGGVGLIVCQWAKHLGATVIGTVGDDEKAALAKANGCDHPINYRREDFVARVNEITGGKKCPVVYNSVGKDTFYKSLGLPRAAGADGVVRPVLGRDRPGRYRHPRARRCATSASPSGRSVSARSCLMATARLSRSSHASHTCPMPPDPMRCCSR